MVIKEHKEKVHRTVHDWIQLLSNLAIPLVIGVFAILMNYSQINQTRVQHETDMQIAADNRLNDARVLDDQRKEDILIEYQNFLADLFRNDGKHLQKNDASPFIIRFKTLTALRKLDSARKTFLIQVLYDSELITYSNPINQTAIVNLKSADLRDVQFGMETIPISSTLPDSPVEPLEYRPKPHLSNANLSETDLTNSSFRSIDLSGCLFNGALMDRVNLSYSVIGRSASFRRASLKHATIKGAVYSDVNFGRAILYEAMIDSFRCDNCDFGISHLINIHLISSIFYCPDPRKVSCGFHRANLSGSIIHGSEFVNVTFQLGDFQYINLSKNKFIDGSFVKTNMSQSVIDDTQFNSCFFRETNFTYARNNGSSFVGSFFQSANLSNSQFWYSDFTETIFQQTDLSNTILDYSNFHNATFVRSCTRNTSFVGCILSFADLFDSDITDQQLRQAKTLQGARLPNGTIFV